MFWEVALHPPGFGFSLGTLVLVSANSPFWVPDTILLLWFLSYCFIPLQILMWIIFTRSLYPLILRHIIFSLCLSQVYFLHSISNLITTLPTRPSLSYFLTSEIRMWIFSRDTLQGVRMKRSFIWWWLEVRIGRNAMTSCHRLGSFRQSFTVITDRNLRVQCSIIWVCKSPYAYGRLPVFCYLYMSEKCSLQTALSPCWRAPFFTSNPSWSSLKGDFL